MKIIHHLADIDEGPLGVTIGNFDGVHLGHQHILQTMRQECRRRNLQMVVMTFIPHPKKILLPESKAFLLNSYQERRELLAAQGVDILIEVDFTRDFSTQSASEFLRQHIFVNQALTCFFIGHDFAFGQDKTGGVELARKDARAMGVEIFLLPKFQQQGPAVHSSVIRADLKQGKVDKAKNGLGRPFSRSGVIRKGDGRGKKIGFPTANLAVHGDLLLPRQGVYATRTWCSGMSFFSITNVGARPTFTDSAEVLVETHLFDFHQDIYGEELKVEFLQWVRGEKRFQSANELIEQIQRDTKEVRDYFSAS